MLTAEYCGGCVGVVYAGLLCGVIATWSHRIVADRAHRIELCVEWCFTTVELCVFAEILRGCIVEWSRGGQSR